MFSKLVLLLVASYVASCMASDTVTTVPSDLQDDPLHCGFTNSSDCTSQLNKQCRHVARLAYPAG
jgi:hypothetical protein